MTPDLRGTTRRSSRSDEAASAADSSSRHERQPSGDEQGTQARRIELDGRFVFASKSIRHVLSEIELVAPTDATVLLLGETGVGKEVIARAIHDASRRRSRQMVSVNCAAIPGTLIESELFGHEQGAFTDATSRRIGRFEAAHGSTVLLDEIGDLPLEMQVKLLHVLQERTIERLGSPRSIKVDIRVIAATNRDLATAVDEGTFREDLFYRLNVFPVRVPPLRERAEDIPALVRQFVAEFSRAFGRTIDSVSEDSLLELQGYAWPGNVRELRHVVERAMILAKGGELVIELPKARQRQAAVSGDTSPATRQVDHIRSVLDSTQWRVRGTNGAAEKLGVKPTTLENRMIRLGIRRPGSPRFGVA